MNSLIAKIQSRQAQVGIVGLGYVGLPLLTCFSEAGFRVLGFDVDADKVAALAAGQSTVEHIQSQAIRAALAAGFEPTTDFARASQADAIIICVPTPLDRHRSPDLSFVTGTMDSLLPHLRRGQLVSL
jgi:UDP-N-acetyl-D-glucosamine dehydrogenase